MTVNTHNDNVMSRYFIHSTAQEYRCIYFHLFLSPFLPVLLFARSCANWTSLLLINRYGCRNNKRWSYGSSTLPTYCVTRVHRSVPWVPQWFTLKFNKSNIKNTIYDASKKKKVDLVVSSLHRRGRRWGFSYGVHAAQKKGLRKSCSLPSIAAAAVNLELITKISKAISWFPIATYPRKSSCGRRCNHCHNATSAWLERYIILKFFLHLLLLKKVLIFLCEKS